MTAVDDVMRALDAHDESLDRCGLCIWVGAEPTYTDRMSEQSEWLFDALGDDKRHRADRILARLAGHEVGAAVIRSVGRQYGGEACPRWSLGLYARRDGKPVWNGPPDPSLTEPADSPPPKTLAKALTACLRSAGLSAKTLDSPLDHRVVFRADGEPPLTCVKKEPLLARPSVHDQRVEDAEVFDALAADGAFLICCDVEEGVLRVELPAIKEVPLFLKLLGVLSTAAISIDAPALILAGFPPPVDEHISWMTVTADPAVIEINMAPVSRTAELLKQLRQLDSVTVAEGLASYRLQYNGEESDSGGGGQITLGGASAEGSPFLTTPHLLPGLVRYFNRHPSLSYLHAFESVGPASQAPRADEGPRGALSELSLALELLGRTENPSPEIIWDTLTPFLADPSGNSHRSEINIEKLWNPFLGARGLQGLVEFRALRMGPSAETTASLAALLRAVAAMLAEHPCHDPLIEWRDELYQRFSLPYYLHRDMEEVLADLDKVGLGLGQPLVKYLLRDQDLVLTKCKIGGTQLEVRRALEFWPLVGDVATQERGGSRLIDASTSRVEIRLRANNADSALGDWKLSVDDWAIPLGDAEDAAGRVRITGLRYRRFVPQRGLHPTLGAQTPLSFCLSHPTDGAWRMTIHLWDPTGAAYPGLPKTIDEARSRRQARCVIEKLDKPPTSLIAPPDEAIGTHVVDLRWK
ncbi:transglutaminase family protein [Aporhodopirellula aestuarii]|uniref:Transglutaminase family protein n=1 Tax=Aporhodopirellula aestuarii TaxID=2950107 RepID=A0ABT0UBM1_9BACT|nr:transglutaminase family protein [Aporhodopirellula aestuarii]MCM2374419.1 transglutaminase family protein [Aporhodopirellula aestuarii]